MQTTTCSLNPRTPHAENLGAGPDGAFTSATKRSWKTSVYLDDELSQMRRLGTGGQGVVIWRNAGELMVLSGRSP